MAQRAVRDFGCSIIVANTAFGISQTCYRYQSRDSDINLEIADWLVRLTRRRPEFDWHHDLESNPLKVVAD